MKVVAICGSMQFSQEMQKIAGDLAIKNGWCVLQCVYGIDKNSLTEEKIAQLKAEHLKRIELSDAIYVVNIGGFIGESTKIEIEFAKEHKKEIIYHEFNLREELESYTPFDKHEKENVQKVIQFLTTHSNCYDRSNLEGHVTAGGLVVDLDGNVLLNHHKKTGLWFQFGGHGDGESNCINVARREISEEAGIYDCKLMSDKILDVDVQQIAYSAKKNEPKHLHFDINFLFAVKNKEFKISNESTEIKWVTLDEAKKLISPKDHAMQRMLEKYKNLLESSR